MWPFSPPVLAFVLFIMQITTIGDPSIFEGPLYMINPGIVLILSFESVGVARYWFIVVTYHGDILGPSKSTVITSEFWLYLDDCIFPAFS